MLLKDSKRISRLLDDPRWLAYRLDCAGGNIGFIRLPKAEIRNASFLDSRVGGLAQGKAVIPVDRIFSGLPRTGIPRVPRFIFHTAFCCSTLLSRALAVGGYSVSLREPLPMRDLADAQRGGVVETRNAMQLTQLLLRLLDRHANASEALVIKPSNLCNSLIGPCLRDSNSRGIYIVGSLSSFLVSVLKKGPDMHQRLPWLLGQLGRDIHYSRKVGIQPARHHDVLQFAAMIWHCQRLLADQQIRVHSDQMLVLDQDELLSEPEETLNRARDWLQLPWGSEAISQVLQGRVFKTHAKETHAPYSAKIRARENQQVIKEYQQEIGQTLRWVEPILNRAPVSDLRGNNLFSWSSPSESRHALPF